METLKEKTAKGLFWGGMNNGVQQLLGLAFGIILARLLDASDYGMTAMLAIFSVIANELQSSGFKTGLINMKAPAHKDYNAVFWFNILAGAVIYLILFFCAPLIADYFHQPKLIPLSRYVFLGFVFSSFGIAQSAYMTKQMQIKQIAKCGMTATLMSSMISVILAALGFGYWALATQYLAYIAINTLLLWYFSEWRPTIKVTFEPIRRLFPFSFKIMVSAIFTQVNNYIMNLLLGHYYGETNTGHYNQAYLWSSKCFLLVGNMMRQVDQTVLVGLHDERERQLMVLRKMVRFTAFIAFPMLFGLGLVSHEFIILAIGEKWTFSASLLPYLSLEYDGAWHSADYTLGGTVASGYLCDGDSLYIIEYSMGVCVAFLHVSPDGISSAGIFKGYHALCFHCCSGDGGNGLCHTKYRKLVAVAAESCCYCSRALLLRHAYCWRRHPEGMPRFY